MDIQLQQKEFDLSRYVITMNGNDLQDLLLGTTHEEERQKRWKENSSKERIKQLLRKRGWSPEFLDRMNGIYLQRPLTKEEVFKAFEVKFLKPEIKKIQVSHPNLTVDYNRQFLEDTAQFFFNGSSLRDLRTFAQDRVGAAILKSIPEGMGWKEPIHLDLSLSDTLREDPESSVFGRKISLVVQRSATKEVPADTRSTDLTLDMPKYKRLGLDSRDPVFNNALAQVLAQVKDRLKSRIKGQDDLIERTVRVIKAVYGNPENGRCPEQHG